MDEIWNFSIWFVDYHACVLPQNMPGSLESLFKNETYKAILMASGGIQVMSAWCLNR